MSEKKEEKKDLAVVNRGTLPTAIDLLARKLSVSKDVMISTLKATAFKECKTNEEFVSAVIVANTYGLNPLLKEIYVYADKGAVIPVVSTDGWNKLMTTHKEYKTHYYVQSETMATMKGAKPCPEWIEIHIVKKDGSEVVVREYLDECFRDLSFKNPWQTHTKRMLRHKTKIQGAREAFGFGGIYDEDEAQRIKEAREFEPLALESSKPEVQEPKPLDTTGAENTPAQEQQPKEEAKTVEDITIGKLLEIPVGYKVGSVIGRLAQIGEREKKGKMKDVIALYTVTDEDGNAAVISVWGKPLNFPLDTFVKFTDVVITEYKDERQYSCYGVVVRADVVEEK